VRIKCYNLTDISKWYTTIFRDPEDLEPVGQETFLCNTHIWITEWS